MNTSTAQQGEFSFLVEVDTTTHNKQRLLLKLVYEQRLWLHLMYPNPERKGVIPCQYDF
jgi:hypothetical protein